MTTKVIRQRDTAFGNQEVEAVKEVLTSGWITEGRKTAEFEKALVSLTQRKYAVAVSSGGVALYLALKAAGIGNGDEVIVPDYQMIALANAVTLTGAKPVFVDVKPEDGNMNPEELASVVSPRTRAIVPIHINGRFAAMPKIESFGRSHRLMVIEDACQALGSKMGDAPLGSGESKAACLSFHPSKIVTTGTGGAVLTDDEEFAIKVKALKDYGQTTRGKVQQLPDNYETWGFNFRFTDIQAAIGLAQLQRFEDRKRHTLWLYRFYNENIDDSFRLGFEEQAGFLPWVCDIRLKKPINRELKERLLEGSGVETRLPYKPMHLQPLYSKSTGAGDFSGATAAWQENLWLPTGPHINEEAAQHVVQAVNKVATEMIAE